LLFINKLVYFLPSLSLSKARRKPLNFEGLKPGPEMALTTLKIQSLLKAGSNARVLDAQGLHLQLRGPWSEGHRQGIMDFALR
jgi:hypothetical protein